MYEVDGQQLTEEQLQDLRNDPNIKLVEVSPNCYKTKQRLLG